MQKYGRLVIKNSVLDSLVCSRDSLILDVASPRTHKPKIVNESLLVLCKTRLLVLKDCVPNFFLILTKTYVVGTQKYRLNEMVLLSTHSLC